MHNPHTLVIFVIGFIMILVKEYNAQVIRLTPFLIIFNPLIYWYGLLIWKGLISLCLLTLLLLYTVTQLRRKMKSKGLPRPIVRNGYLMESTNFTSRVVLWCYRPCSTPLASHEVVIWIISSFVSIKMQSGTLFSSGINVSHSVGFRQIWFSSEH